jgi:hypothetical protein
MALLRQLNPPPRLVAHLALVHDVAWRLLDAFVQRWPTLAIDADSVCFGAATHDLGKLLHPHELTGPGQQHAADGPDFLIAAGVEPQHARFSRTHRTWRSARVALEDLIVALADTCWKGSRNPVLEQQVIESIQHLLGKESWETMLVVDQLVEDLAAGADGRLGWQASFSPLGCEGIDVKPNDN